MRKIIIALCVFGLAACSSTPETTDTEPTVTDTTATTTTATTPTTTTTTEPDTTTSVTADTGGDMAPIPEGGAFPPIDGTEKMTATCLRSSDTRIVSVLDRTGGGCGTVYTKHGDKQTVAMANFDMNYCDKVFENIKGNLSSAGFDCGGGTTPTPTETKPAEGGN